jgi:hypothetical protein
MRIVVVGSVPGQEGGSDPSKGGNGGGSFSGSVTRGWMQGWVGDSYSVFRKPTAHTRLPLRSQALGSEDSESRWSALARATAWVRLSTWSLL